MTTQNNGSMTALEAGLEAVLFAAGDAVTIERLSAALEVAPAELLAAAGKFFFYFCCFSDSSDPVSGTVDLYIVFCAAL